MPKQRHQCVTDCSSWSMALTNRQRSPTREVSFHGISVEIAPAYDKTVTHVARSICYLCPDTVPPLTLSPKEREQHLQFRVGFTSERQTPRRVIPKVGRRFSLSTGQRAGVRGNRMSSVIQMHL